MSQIFRRKWRLNGNARTDSQTITTDVFWNNGDECTAVDAKGELIVACMNLCKIGGNCLVFGKDFILGYGKFST